jgi:hypothetical protein
VAFDVCSTEPWLRERLNFSNMVELMRYAMAHDLLG